MAEQFHYPPEIFNLLVDTIPLLCRSKRDVIGFFQGAGVNWSSHPGHRLRCLCRFLLHGYWRQVVVVAVEPDSVVSHEEASYILPGFFNCHVALLGHPL